MKAKTKDQLRAEIDKLEIERDVLKRMLKDMQKLSINILLALEHTVRITLIHSPDKYDSLAWFITAFFAGLKSMAGSELVKLADDKYYEGMGFDEVTTMMIKRRIPILIEINKMTLEGKSDEEIRKFIDKQKEVEGR